MRVVEISTVLEQAAGYIHYNARCPSSRSAKYFADSGIGRLLLLRKCIIVLRFTALLVCDALLVEFLRANVKVAGCLPLLRGTSCMLEDATAKLVLAGYATAISFLLREGTLLYLPLADHAIFFPPSFAHTVIIFSGRRGKLNKIMRRASAVIEAVMAAAILVAVVPAVRNDALGGQALAPRGAGVAATAGPAAPKGEVIQVRPRGKLTEQGQAMCAEWRDTRGAASIHWRRCGGTRRSYAPARRWRPCKIGTELPWLRQSGAKRMGRRWRVRIGPGRWSPRSASDSPFRR